MTTDQLIQSFYENKNLSKSIEMSKYMKNQFAFLGIPAPQRKALTRVYLKTLKKTSAIDWPLINLYWEKDFREFQYLAIDILSTLEHILGPNDLPYMKHFILMKSWWDTIDGFNHIVGSISLRYPELNDILLTWSKDPNIWLRRIAIDHQLLRKERTNEVLLEKIIVNNLNQTEFFINKAIGWSLRDYSKTNPLWVCEFIAKYKDQMSPLSIKEASKYIKKASLNGAVN